MFLQNSQILYKYTALLQVELLKTLAQCISHYFIMNRFLSLFSCFQKAPSYDSLSLAQNSLKLQALRQCLMKLDLSEYLKFKCGPNEFLNQSWGYFSALRRVVEPIFIWFDAEELKAELFSFESVNALNICLDHFELSIYPKILIWIKRCSQILWIASQLQCFTFEYLVSRNKGEVPNDLNKENKI